MIGNGSTTVDGAAEYQAKSIGKETTMGDTSDYEEIKKIYTELCSRLAREMKRNCFLYEFYLPLTVVLRNYE